MELQHAAGVRDGVRDAEQAWSIASPVTYKGCIYAGRKAVSILEARRKQSEAHAEAGGLHECRLNSIKLHPHHLHMLKAVPCSAPDLEHRFLSLSTPT